MEPGKELSRCISAKGSYCSPSPCLRTIRRDQRPATLQHLLSSVKLIYNLQRPLICGAGSLPVAWAVPGALASLEALVASANNLSGTLPTEWGVSPAVFPALKMLDVRENGLEGYLPDDWGTGFQVRDRLAVLEEIEKVYLAHGVDGEL